MKWGLLMLLFSLASSYTGWLTDLEKAKETAAEKHCYILLNFSGSDWCVPCIQLKKQVFDTDEFRAFADTNLVLVNVDFPRTNKRKLDKQQLLRNEQLAEKYNPGGRFPFTLLLNADGNVIKSWDGLPGTTTSAFIMQIKSIQDAAGR